MTNVRIDTGTPSHVDLCRDLWVSVHHVHQASMPELAPYVSDEQTWDSRRALYARLLAERDAVLLLARDDADEVVGYALAFVHQADEDWLSDTWQVGGPVGELESLAVRPSHRGQGIGTALMAAVDEAMGRRGVVDMVVGVLPGNLGARRLYERLGYRPTWMYLSRLQGRK